jgi:AAA domain
MPTLYTPTGEKKLRLAIYGEHKVGKNHLGLTAGGVVIFPGEDSCEEFVDRVPPFRALRFDPDNLVDEALAALQTAQRGGYGCNAFLWDSYSLFEDTFKATDGARFNVDDKKMGLQQRGRLKAEIEKKLLRPLAAPSACHIIVTAHVTDAYAEVEGNNGYKSLKAVGKRPKATERFEHYFDLVGHLERDRATNRRTLTITESRFESVLPRGTVITNPTFAGADSILARLSRATPTVPTTGQLKETWQQKGAPNGSFRAWLAAAGVPIEGNLFTVDARVDAQRKLEALPNQVAA